MFGSIQGLFFVGGMMRSRAGEDIFRTDGCMLRIGAWQRPSAGLSWMYTDETVRLPPRRCMAGALVGQGNQKRVRKGGERRCAGTNKAWGCWKG